MSNASSKNMKLISHNTLTGFGGIGEGVSLQVTKGGRRVMWLAHEGAPKNFTGVDVTDIKNPKVICQTELPHKQMRSNSLEVCGDILAVAYQTIGPSGKNVDPGYNIEPAGIELFDISTPEEPKTISFFDCHGPGSAGVHQLWFDDGEYIHFSGGATDHIARNGKDTQFYRCIDVKDPTKPTDVGRWWYPGTKEGDVEDPPARHPVFDNGFRAHNTNVFPERPDRVYMGYLDGGTIILDISDKAHPKMISHWNPHPPFPGFTHTALPLFDKDILIVSDECNRDGGEDWPKMNWVVDMREETNLVPIGTLPMPDLEEFGRRGGRFGAHNLHENRTGPSFRSSKTVFATLFNAGLRAYDLSNPFAPQEIAHFIPEDPANSRVNCAQINDVFVDENQIVYCVDRFSGGLYCLEMEIDI
jgi:hypothetical protein